MNAGVLEAEEIKTLQMDIENGKEDFTRHWELIGAEGDKEKALSEFEICHNAS